MTMIPSQSRDKDKDQDKYKLGVVSYLNARPLVAGLESDPRVELNFDVPARLPVLLDDQRVDAALVPVIDIMKEDRLWRILSDACIGCDGETLTVRVFSRVQADSIQRLHVDGDSHTSVALARIIWREMYDTHLEVIPYTGQESIDECEAILLIGDKVVNNTLLDYEIETDLGSAWKTLTSLPFVFAAWAVRQDTKIDVVELSTILSSARDRGVSSAEMIAADYGPALGWPVTLASRYLTTRIKFDLGSRQRLGMEKFLELAKQNDIVPSHQELVFA